MHLPLKILIVHSDLEKTIQLVETVKRITHRVCFHQSGESGFRAASHYKYDLIICQQDLPQLDGFTLVKSVRDFSINQTTPILFLATCQGPNVQELRQYGMVEVAYPSHEAAVAQAAYRASVAPRAKWSYLLFAN
jgi:PleD family two-component response regulator